MLLRISLEEFDWLSRRLGRLAQVKEGRSKDQHKLIKETAAKFTGTYSAVEDTVAIPLQRRHLRLLEELQIMSIQAILQGTIPELERRAAAFPDKHAHYMEKVKEANALAERSKVLLSKIEKVL